MEGISVSKMSKMPAQKPGRSKQDYGTPEVFLKAVRRALGVKDFSHDFAADDENAVCPSYWTIKDDSLKQSNDKWREKVGLYGWGWLNPPFSHIGPWAEKCAEVGSDGGHIAFLVPASVGSNWYRDFVHTHARVLFLNGRITFVGCKQGYPKDCILALYGPDVIVGYDVWKWMTDYEPVSYR